MVLVECLFVVLLVVYFAGGGTLYSCVGQCRIFGALRSPMVHMYSLWSNTLSGL